MKRSEMVKFLHTILKEHMNCDCCPSEEAICFRLLHELELKGMKPPERVFWNRRPDGGLMPSSKNGEMVPSWEPEND